MSPAGTPLASPETPAPKFKVAVCGGGIAGLCLAVALSKHAAIQVTIYEATSSFKEIGAGVMIWGRAWQILSSLGLAKELREMSGLPVDGSEDASYSLMFRRADVDSEGHLIHPLQLPYPSHYFHRADFLDVLVGKLPVGVACFGKRLASYSSHLSSETVDLHFVDGTTASCDVLVGCDGIKSAVRKRMFEGVAEAERRPEMLQYIDPVWTGEILYRCLIPSERWPLDKCTEDSLLKKPMVYCGRNKHFLGFPIKQGAFVNIGAFVTQPEAWGTPWNKPWVMESSAQELLDHYDGWESEVLDVMKVMDKPSKWAVHQVRSLPFFTQGPVVLLGDAAHAMTTHQGYGAGQAIEDAFVLAGLLGHPSVTKANLTRALKAYERVRLPFVKDVMEASARAGAIYELRDAQGNDYDTFVQSLHEMWQWVGTDDPQDQLKRAVGELIVERETSVRAAL